MQLIHNAVQSCCQPTGKVKRNLSPPHCSHKCCSKLHPTKQYHTKCAQRIRTTDSRCNNSAKASAVPCHWLSVVTSRLQNSLTKTTFKCPVFLATERKTCVWTNDLSSSQIHITQTETPTTYGLTGNRVMQRCNLNTFTIGCSVIARPEDQRKEQCTITILHITR